ARERSKVGAGLYPGSVKELEPDAIALRQKSDVIALDQNEVSAKIPGEKYVQKNAEAQSREEKQLERSCTPLLNVKVGARLHQKVGAGLHPGSFRELESDTIALYQNEVIAKIPGENVGLQNYMMERSSKIPGEKVLNRISRYISVYRKREVGERCSYPGCPRPADVIHHHDRFSEHHSHENLKPLCKQHHEFAHNGVSEVMRSVDYKYRKHRRVALLC
ncbi:hypothetical protein KKG71_04470, partial [Patescibacteria group bacterium]|nr:hypothetical protein [Patescibacteria group bacterium]